MAFHGEGMDCFLKLYIYTLDTVRQVQCTYVNVTRLSD